MTPLDIESATFWLVAQCLNQLHHHVNHPPLRQETKKLSLVTHVQQRTV